MIGRCLVARAVGLTADNLNSRLLVVAPRDGVYRIVATSYGQEGQGAYTLTIRVFHGKILVLNGAP